MTIPLNILAERLSNYSVDENGCWRWGGHLMHEGYGVIKSRGERVRAHRASYMVHVGPIPDGLVLDHLCRVRDCIRPDHLEAVTNRENIHRGMAPHIVIWRSGKCARGHQRRNKYGSCLDCHAEVARKRREKEKQERVALRAAGLVVCDCGRTKTPRKNGAMYCEPCFAAARNFGKGARA